MSYFFFHKLKICLRTQDRLDSYGLTTLIEEEEDCLANTSIILTAWHLHKNIQKATIKQIPGKRVIVKRYAESVQDTLVIFSNKQLQKDLQLKIISNNNINKQLF